MTSRDRLARASEQFGEEMVATFERLEALRGGQLARISQLRRARAVLEDALGDSWYERWLAWSHWQTYLFLGKLETAAWMMRKPRSPTP